MTQIDIVQMLMTPGTDRAKSATFDYHSAARLRESPAPDNAGLVYRVPDLAGAYHIDVIQPLTDSRVMPGMIVLSQETMVSLPKSARQARSDPHYTAIEARVARLRTLTKTSGDPFVQQSAKRLLVFCHNLAADRKPAIFPLLNGNLRAIWENDAKEQIGIQFLPNGKLQYVIFRLHAGELIETMGTELDERGIRHLIDALGLRRLWFNGGW